MARADSCGGDRPGRRFISSSTVRFGRSGSVEKKLGRKRGEGLYKWQCDKKVKLMIAAASFLAFVGVLAGDAKVTVEAPNFFVAGQPFQVRLVLEAPADGASLEGWQTTPAGFLVDGKALAEHGNESALVLGAGEKKTIEVDLSKALKAQADFELAWGTLPGKKVHLLEAAPKDLKFMDEAAIPATALAQYQVLLITNRGDILVEFWPDVAPNHVRNFLDLSYSGFYDGLTFHRVIPGFMIQGGDPEGMGSGGGPRRVKAEFSQKKHVRGVLSMARSKDPDSASSQFFIMHGDYPSLDGSYSAFGQVLSGMDAVDKIVNTPRGQNDKPKENQVIRRAIVVKAISPALLK